MSTRQRTKMVVAEAAVVLLAALLLAGCGGGSRGSPSGTTPTTADIRVYPPDSAPFGKTYAEWSVAWWQRVYSVAKAENPLLDETGANTGVGQSGPVWFLCGTWGPSAERTCTVPRDKALFFPVYNIVGYYEVEGSDPAWEPKMWDGVRNFLDHVTQLSASVDGVAIQNLRDCRSTASRFEFTFHEQDPVLPMQGLHYGFGGGYWVMLEPLSQGRHDITWNAECFIPGDVPDNDYRFTQAVTYHLTVQ